MVAGHNTIISNRTLDFYPTQRAWTQVLVDQCGFTGEIHEPCCGDGSMSRVLADAGYIVHSSDVHDYGYGNVEDAFNILAHENVVTNPPYKHAEELIHHWLSTTTGKVAVLLRMNWLEGSGRYERFMGRRPQIVIVVVNRMVVFGKTSQFPHAWFIWNNRRPRPDTRLLWAKA